PVEGFPDHRMLLRPPGSPLVPAVLSNLGGPARDCPRELPESAFQFSTGILTSNSVPRPITESICNVPPTAFRRSRIPTRPRPVRSLHERTEGTSKPTPSS